MASTSHKSPPPLELPEDLEALRAQVRHLSTVVAERDLALAERDATIESLTAQLRLAIARRFASPSERVAEGQLGLFNEAEVLATEPEAEESAVTPGEVVEVAAHARVRGKRAPLPAHLPRVEVLHELAEAEQVCPRDGTRLERFGEETSEQLDIVPATVRVLHHVRAKYRCPCCREHVVTASMPAQPIAKSQASPGLLAYVATAKYVDALPLHRQAGQFERIDCAIPRQTLARWMVRCGSELVVPLVNLLRDHLLEAPYLHMDETTVQVLDEPGRAPEAKSWLWCQTGDTAAGRIVLFDYDPSRSGEVPKRLLGEFAGYLHTDGYAGYNAVVEANGICQLHCFAHARRHFVDGLKALGINPAKLPAKPPDKARRLLRGLAFIRTLYTIERRISELPPTERHAVRLAESALVLERLREWVDDTRPRVAPKTPLGQALGYLHNHWSGLTRFLDDGRLAIDNNAAENAIRPFVVGRRNWLFSATTDGATASANLYSLIDTAKANGLDPYAYLRHVFTQLPGATCVEDIEALLPLHIKPDALTIHTQ
ncbi:MAG: IS66 family transposase [Enhydrobacter sp.]|nr:IS66 family transposase [Enhydrobacter sp.]